MLLSDEIKQRIDLVIDKFYEPHLNREEIMNSLYSELHEISSLFIQRIKEYTLTSNGTYFESALVQSINIYHRAVEDSRKDWREVRSKQHTDLERIQSIATEFNSMIDEFYYKIYTFLELYLYMVYSNAFKDKPSIQKRIDNLYKEHKFRTI